MLRLSQASRIRTNLRAYSISACCPYGTASLSTRKVEGPTVSRTSRSTLGRILSVALRVVFRCFLRARVAPRFAFRMGQSPSAGLAPPRFGLRLVANVLGAGERNAPSLARCPHSARTRERSPPPTIDFCGGPRLHCFASASVSAEFADDTGFVAAHLTGSLSPFPGVHQDHLD
jgi:hypothetical protein